MDKVYKWNKAKTLFQNTHFEKDYLKYVRAKNSGKILGYFTLFEIGASIGLLYSDSNTSESFDPNKLLGLLVLVFLVPTTGTIGIISALTALNRRVKLMDAFNEQIPNTSFHQLHKNKWQLSFTFNAMSAGLRLSF